MSHKNKVTLALAALYIIWGSTFLGVKYVLEVTSPVFASGLRFTIGGGLLWLLLFLKNRKYYYKIWLFSIRWQ